MLLPGWDWREMGHTHTMNMARLRAIENGYSLIRIDFIGVSAAFDPYGRVLAMQDTLPGQSHMMIADLPARRVWTLYGQIGDVFAWLCFAAAFGLCSFGAVRPARAF
jgi:apolipoprotein N-acyltransferase